MFDSSHYDYKDQNSEKIIRYAGGKNELYYWMYLRDPSLLLLPTFSILKVMFPLLFKNSEYENLHYDICEFTKHKCVTFSNSNKRNLVSFLLIHSNTQDHLTYLIILRLDDLCYLLTIALEQPGYFNSKSNIMLVILYLSSAIW